MPPTRNREAIRARLETDRPWSVYALGDLSPGLFEESEWRAAPGDAPGLLLLYRGVQPPVLFTHGESGSLGPLLDEIAEEPALSLSVRPAVLPLVEARWPVRRREPMWRMLLDPELAPPLGTGGSVRLGPEDAGALQALYADGEETGEAPDFFYPSMLERGVFFGIREGDALVAAAGTHLVAPEEGVAAVGNVYTARSHRGRGLAARATGAVVEELLRAGIRTIALNVAQRNESAFRVYERLGFRRYCAFYEGLASE